MHTQISDNAEMCISRWRYVSSMPSFYIKKLHFEYFSSWFWNSVTIVAEFYKRLGFAL